MNLTLADLLITQRRRSRLAGAVLVVCPLVAVLAAIGVSYVPLLAVPLAVLILMAILLVGRGLEDAATAILALSMFFAPMNSVRAGGFVTAADLLFVAGIGLLVPSFTKRRVWLPPLVVGAWLVLLVLGCLASINALEVGASFNKLARFLAATVMLPLAFLLWGPTRETVTRLAGAFIAGSTVSVLYGIAHGQGQRLYGLTIHPNYLGLTCLMAVALVPFVAATVRVDRRWLVWGTAVINLYGVWACASRATFGALAVTVLVYIVVERSYLVTGGVLFGIAMAIVTWSNLDSDTNVIGRVLGGGDTAGSDLERSDMTRQGMERFWQHPIFGSGFEHVIPGHEVIDYHNIYLQVAVSIGLVGLVTYLVLLGSLVGQLFTATGPLHRLAYPTVAYALVGPFTNSLWDRFVWAALTLSFVGIRLAKGDPPTGQDPTEDPAPTRAREALA